MVDGNVWFLSWVWEPWFQPCSFVSDKNPSKATTCHKEYLPPNTAADWTCQHTPTGQINQVISQFPLQLVQFTALHGGEKGEGMSDSALEINTLKKIVRLSERPACLSAAACTVKTAQVIAVPHLGKALSLPLPASSLGKHNHGIMEIKEVPWGKYKKENNVIKDHSKFNCS